MKLLKVTQNGYETQTLFLNPAHIVSLQQFDGYTTVRMVSTSKAGEGLVYHVAEHLSDLQEQLYSM